jgi:hypothetical protein
VGFVQLIKTESIIFRSFLLVGHQEGLQGGRITAEGGRSWKRLFWEAVIKARGGPYEGQVGEQQKDS